MYYAVIVAGGAGGEVARSYTTAAIPLCLRHTPSVSLLRPAPIMVIGGIAEVILYTVALCSRLVRVDGVNVIREGSYKMRLG